MADYTEWIEDGIRYRRFQDGSLEQVPVSVISQEPEMLLTINLDQEVVETGTQVTATAEVRDQSGNLVSINASYFVPIMRSSDNWQAKLLEVQFKEGQATVQFTINEPGIYTIDLTKVYPKPKSELASNPILVVKETI